MEENRILEILLLLELDKIILLDLNMLRKDGREVLEDLKSDDELKSVPVTVMPILSNQLS